MSQIRQPGYDINPLFTKRWSPRAFTPEPLSRDQLFSLFEAARWAPSAYNAQPWRFIYALRDDPHWTTFLDLLIEFNRSWAANAAALVFVVSRTDYQAPGKDTRSPFPTHAFDSGAAWAQLALQAQHAGWSTHGMAGFDRLKAREALGIPADHELQIAIAIGRAGDPDSLPAGLKEREIPSQRVPLDTLVAEGRFNFKAS